MWNGTVRVWRIKQAFSLGFGKKANGFWSGWWESLPRKTSRHTKLASNVHLLIGYVIVSLFRTTYAKHSKPVTLRFIRSTFMKMAGTQYSRTRIKKSIGHSELISHYCEWFRSNQIFFHQKRNLEGRQRKNGSFWKTKPPKLWYPLLTINNTPSYFISYHRDTTL